MHEEAWMFRVKLHVPGELIVTEEEVSSIGIGATRRLAYKDAINDLHVAYGMLTPPPTILAIKQVLL